MHFIWDYLVRFHKYRGRFRFIELSWLVNQILSYNENHVLVLVVTPVETQQRHGRWTSLDIRPDFRNNEYDNTSDWIDSSVCKNMDLAHTTSMEGGGLRNKSYAFCVRFE